MESHNFLHLTLDNKYYDRFDKSLFPEPFDNGLRLRDFLENEVEEKYYLSQYKIKSIANWKSYQKPFERINGNNSISPTLTARGAGEEHSGMITYSNKLEQTTNLQEDCLNKDISVFRIRKLTPKECYRLMGFSDEDFEKARATGNSATQLYKQAGNSIVVNVLEEIYKCLHNAYPNDFTKGMNVMSLFSGIGAFEKALERVDFENFTQPQSE